MTQYTTFERDLLSLGWLRNEVHTIYSEYPRDNRPETEFHIRAIVRYFLGIRLHDFVQIRCMICKDLEAMKKLALDTSLKPFWEPIINHKRAIGELRNKYLAHLQEKEDFETQIADILTKYQYPKSHGDARYFAGCAWKYCHFVILNFPDEFSSADKKYRGSNQTRSFTINIKDYAHAISALKKAQDQALIDLKAKGFKVLE